MGFPMNSHNGLCTLHHSGLIATKLRMMPMQDLSTPPDIARQRTRPPRPHCGNTMHQYQVSAPIPWSMSVGRIPWRSASGWASVYPPKRNGKRPPAVPMAVATLGETSGTSRKPTAPVIGQDEPSTFRAERTGTPFGSKVRARRLQKRRASRGKCSPCRSPAFQKVQAPTACTTWQATSRSGYRIGITRTTTKTRRCQILRVLLVERSKRCAVDPGSSRRSVFAQATETGAPWTVAPVAQDFDVRWTPISGNSTSSWQQILNPFDPHDRHDDPHTFFIVGKVVDQ